MLKWEMLNPRMTMDRLGYIPYWLNERSQDDAKTQLDKGYQFGGWQPFEGFRLEKDNSLTFPGDPPQKPLAQARLRDELIVFYPSSWIAVIQPDRSFEVCRMD